MNISIVLVDEQPVVRWALRRLLEAEPWTVVTAEATDGIEAVRIVERDAPDILILDLLLTGLSGLDVLSIARQRSPHTRPIVFSANIAEEIVLHALRNGAVGYVAKSAETHEIVEAIRMASSGRHYLSPQLSERALKAYYTAASASTDPHDALTPREREVIQLAAEGSSSPDISARLSISPRTVEMHRASAMKKLHLKNRTELVRYAVRRGMLPDRG